MHFTMRHRTVCFRSSSQYVPNTFTDAFSTVVHHHAISVRSSTGQFEACSCKPTSGGQLPSLVQHHELALVFVTHEDFPSSIPEPESDSRCLNTGHRMACKQVLAMLIPGMRGAPGFDVVLHSYDAS